MEHLQFNKYTSIENTYQAPYLEKVRMVVPANMMWDVTEKVHGSNCSFITDGKTVEFASRSHIIEENEKFFCYTIVLEEHRKRVLDAFQYMQVRCGPIETVQFYGELFGGYYPHENVAKDSRFAAIQKGLYYAPYQSFYGFDIALNYSDGSRVWLKPDEVADVYKENGFFYARSLFRGTLSECLAFNNTFQTHIPEWLGLPPIEDNICEGVVFKPMIPQFFKTGERIVLKNKNERFSEKKGEHVHKEVKDIPEEVQKMSEILNEYVTDNRLCNVISHEGEFDMPKAFGKLMKLFTEDILNDFYKEHLEEWNSFEKSNQKMVTKIMTQAASAVIKKHYGIR